MSGEHGKTDTVTIQRSQLIALLDGVRNVRTGFLMCAPRFAAGSRGERMVAIASALGNTIEDIYAKLEDKNSETSNTPIS